MTPRRTLLLDLALYLISAAFALVTAAGSTLPAHRAWGQIAWYGYAAATAVVLGHLLATRYRPGAGIPARAALTAVTWATTALLPLVVQAVQRAAGRTDRAQEEVLVIERSGARLLDTGTPYLTRDAIAALPADERLLGYTPYQPGMALFGLPRALAGGAWWTDARIWFAVATAIVLVAAALVLLRAGTRPDPLVRAAQAATVLPVCALTLATGGDDLPVLALCLLALAFAATARRHGSVRWLGYAGLAVGAAGALKLFAWPVAVVLLGYAAATAGRRGALALGVPALVLPVLALVPAALVNPAAAIENVLRFPLGRGLVTSPARSPLPGYLIAQTIPGGRAIAIGLVGLAALLMAGWLLRRPPRDAASAALICAVGLTVAMLLLPATRFGYLLYPAAYAAAVPALRLTGSRAARVGRTQIE